MVNMITNSKLTIYHKNGLDLVNRLETWARFNYDNVWVFKTNGATMNKGINEGNNLEVRIPYDETIDINYFSLGDIVVIGEVKTDITKQQDLSETFNITSIKDNFFGNNPHIHLGCK